MRSIVSGSGCAHPVGSRGEAPAVGDARRRDKHVEIAKQTLQSPNCPSPELRKRPLGKPSPRATRPIGRLPLSSGEARTYLPPQARQRKPARYKSKLTYQPALNFDDETTEQ